MDSEKKIKNATVETYAGDMAEVIENDKEGLVKKIIHGEEEHEAEKRNLSPESQKNKLFMAISFLLIALALGIFSFFLLRKTPTATPVENSFSPVIFNDKMYNIEISGMDKDQIIAAVVNEINSSDIKPGELEGIYLTENGKIIGLRQFISLINGNFVPGDNTFFVNDNFLMGVMNNAADVAGSGGKSFFILLKVSSISDVFDVLRSWEDKMLSDLHSFLRVDLSSNTKYLFSQNFEDGIIENKNARVLYDKDGNIVLMYVFADDNSVVITNSPKTVREIILRLSSSQKKQ